jgi:hypothetical protein
MRTTLTIDDDVTATLERLRATRAQSLKDLINEALRRGLKEMEARPKRRARFRTRSIDLGKCRTVNVDNIAEVLAIAEGDAFK